MQINSLDGGRRLSRLLVSLSDVRYTITFAKWDIYHQVKRNGIEMCNSIYNWMSSLHAYELHRVYSRQP